MKTPSQHGKHLESNPKKKAKGCGNYTEHGIGGYNNMHQSHQMEESIHPAAQQTRQCSGRQIGQRITFRDNMLVGELLYLSALKFKFEQKKSSTFLNLFNFTLYSFEGKICVRFCILADCQIYANMLASNCVSIVNNYSNQSLKVISTQPGPFYFSKK